MTSHGRGSNRAWIDTHSADASPAHDVSVAVGQHDHVAVALPVALAVLDGDPARASGHDVEQDQPLGSGVERVGKRERRGLELEGFRELGPEEDRTLEAQLLERGLEQPGRPAVRGGRVGAARHPEAGVSAGTGGSSVMAFPSDPRDTRDDASQSEPEHSADPHIAASGSGRQPSTRDRDQDMAEFPPLAHVAITVRDLSVSTPWYEALFDAEPVIDEDTDPDFHHTVYMIGNSTLIGLHQHGKPAPDEQFSEFRVGLDHIAFGCTNRAELEECVRRLDELGVEHADIKDATYGSGLSFRDPDGIALEFFAPAT